MTAEQAKERTAPSLRRDLSPLTSASLEDCNVVLRELDTSGPTTERGPSTMTGGWSGDVPIQRDDPTIDDTTICEVLVNGMACGETFPDEVAWQEHYEDAHGDDKADQ